MAELILAPTTPETTPAPKVRPCFCERLAPYGIMCRPCDWRLRTPPPLVPAPEKARSPRIEKRSAVGLAGCGAVESAKCAAAAKRRMSARDAVKVLALRD